MPAPSNDASEAQAYMDELKPKAKHCPICNTLFLPKNKWQKFDKRECRDKQYWTTHKIVQIDPITGKIIEEK